MPRNESVGPEVAAFAGVVVDNVEDHLDPRLVEAADHCAELVGVAVREVARLQRKVVVRVVSPVVHEPVAHQCPIVGNRVHRQQLDGRDPQLRDVIDHRRLAQSQERSA